MDKELEYIIKRKNKIGKKLDNDQNLLESCGEYKSSDKQWFGWLEEYETLQLIEKKLKALEIIKECLVSEFKLFEKDGEYFILFYFDEIHELLFKLRNKEEYELLVEVLLWLWYRLNTLMEVWISMKLE